MRREANGTRPWTEDPVLAEYRFCNVHREDDKVTRWFRDNVRERLRDQPTKVLLSTVVFRWFNRIETGERILTMLQDGVWEPDHVRHMLRDVSPLVTGAYMIKTPTGMSKLEGIIWCVDQLMEEEQRNVVGRLSCDPSDCDLEYMHAILCESPFMGPFMSYEVVSDLRHTVFGDCASDINSWASAGPGCARGLGWVFYGAPDAIQRGPAINDRLMMKHMDQLWECATHPEYWPREWPRWEMREVEHWCCEFDKWCRATYNGQRLKRRFTT